MDFAHNGWLWTLAILPIVAARGVARRAQRQDDWTALGQTGRAPLQPSIAWLVAMASLIIALAEPHWGRSAGSTLPPGRDLVIAIDVSRSMAARDALPDRLGVARESTESLIDAIGKNEGDRVALILFAGRGVLRCPLTRNLGAALEMVRSIRVGSVQPGGTNLGAGLDAAFDALDDFDRSGGQTIIVFSDGEDHAGAWPTAVKRLGDRGVLVHTVALGDAQRGYPIPYRDSTVITRRTDEALATIARKTGGVFVPLGTATTDMGRLYQTRLEPRARRVRDDRGGGELAVPRFPWFLGAALVFMLIASRPREWRVPGLFLAALLFLTGATPIDPISATRDGLAAYGRGRFEEALKAFREAIKAQPEHPLASYNLGATLYQIGRYQEALKLYQNARVRADAPLRLKIDYALGNTALSLGDPASALRHYEDCLAATGIGLDSVRRDAAVNREFAQNLVRQSRGESGPGMGNPRKKAGNAQGSSKGRNPEAPGVASSGQGVEASTARRGVGGAGETGPAAAATAGDSTPESQLDRALAQIREGRRSRIDEVDADASRDNLKDW